MGGHTHTLCLASRVCLVTFHSTEELPLPSRFREIEGQEMGQRNFPDSEDGPDPHPCRQVPQGLCS